MRKNRYSTLEEWRRARRLQGGGGDGGEGESGDTGTAGGSEGEGEGEGETGGRGTADAANTAFSDATAGFGGGQGQGQGGNDGGNANANADAGTANANAAAAEAAAETGTPGAPGEQTTGQAQESPETAHTSPFGIASPETFSPTLGGRGTGLDPTTTALDPSFQVGWLDAFTAETGRGGKGGKGGPSEEAETTGRGPAPGPAGGLFGAPGSRGPASTVAGQIGLWGGLGPAGTGMGIGGRGGPSAPGYFSGFTADRGAAPSAFAGPAGQIGAANTMGWAGVGYAAPGAPSAFDPAETGREQGQRGSPTGQQGKGAASPEAAETGRNSLAQGQMGYLSGLQDISPGRDEFSLDPLSAPMGKANPVEDITPGRFEAPYQVAQLSGRGLGGRGLGGKGQAGFWGPSAMPGAVGPEQDLEAAYAQSRGGRGYTGLESLNPQTMTAEIDALFGRAAPEARGQAFAQFTGKDVTPFSETPAAREAAQMEAAKGQLAAQLEALAAKEAARAALEETRGPPGWPSHVNPLEQIGIFGVPGYVADKGHTDMFGNPVEGPDKGSIFGPPSTAYEDYSLLGQAPHSYEHANPETIGRAGTEDPEDPDIVDPGRPSIFTVAHANPLDRGPQENPDPFAHMGIARGQSIFAGVPAPAPDYVSPVTEIIATPQPPPAPPPAPPQTPGRPAPTAWPALVEPLPPAPPQPRNAPPFPGIIDPREVTLPVSRPITAPQPFQVPMPTPNPLPPAARAGPPGGRTSPAPGSRPGATPAPGSRPGATPAPGSRGGRGGRDAPGGRGGRGTASPGFIADPFNPYVAYNPWGRGPGTMPMGRGYNAGGTVLMPPPPGDLPAQLIGFRDGGSVPAMHVHIHTGGSVEKKRGGSTDKPKPQAGLTQTPARPVLDPAAVEAMRRRYMAGYIKGKLDRERMNASRPPIPARPLVGSTGGFITGPGHYQQGGEINEAAENLDYSDMSRMGQRSHLLTQQAAKGAGYNLRLPERYASGSKDDDSFQAGGLTTSGMSAMGARASYGARDVGRIPGVRLIHSDIPGRTDRIPMKARTGSYVLPADVVSGMGQGNTYAGAKMWNDALKQSAGPYGAEAGIKPIRTARMPRPPSTPRMPSIPVPKIPKTSSGLSQTKMSSATTFKAPGKTSPFGSKHSMFERGGDVQEVFTRDPRPAPRPPSGPPPIQPGNTPPIWGPWPHDPYPGISPGRPGERLAGDLIRLPITPSPQAGYPTAAEMEEGRRRGLPLVRPDANFDERMNAWFQRARNTGPRGMQQGGDTSDWIPERFEPAQRFDKYLSVNPNTVRPGFRMPAGRGTLEGSVDVPISGNPRDSRIEGRWTVPFRYQDGGEVDEQDEFPEEYADEYDGGEIEEGMTPIIVSGGEMIVDPEIVEAIGDGDAELGRKELEKSVLMVRQQVMAEMKKLKKPVG